MEGISALPLSLVSEHFVKLLIPWAGGKEHFACSAPGPAVLVLRGTPRTMLPGVCLLLSCLYRVAGELGRA